MVSDLVVSLKSVSGLDVCDVGAPGGYERNTR